jgi:nuclear cap-binding protein subunit 1
MASPTGGSQEQASALLQKTSVIALTQHKLEALVDPYFAEDGAELEGSKTFISLLQNQLQAESESGWALSCLPRPYKMPPEVEEGLPEGPALKHAFPALTVPSAVTSVQRVILPEVYFSVFFNQDVETVPIKSNIASSLIRDALVDIINLLDYNRNITAKFLIDVDCYFAPDTFVKRGTPYDKLRDLAGDRSTWKPEDVAVDAVFSQMFKLPVAEHKMVYYHSVLTESCKLAPAAIAPSLGRAIRFVYRSIESMDLDLRSRFLDWFAHHLSNFGFTWKWTEWQALLFYQFCSMSDLKQG